MAESFSQGTVPFWTNSERVLEAKMLLALNASGGGTPGGGSVYRGAGNPNGVVTSTTAAALYYETIAGTLWQFTGIAGANTPWVELLSA